MRCDCGVEADILEVFWEGTMRECRRCSACCPAHTKSQLRMRDPETGIVVTQDQCFVVPWKYRKKRLLAEWKNWEEGRKITEAEIAEEDGYEPMPLRLKVRRFFFNMTRTLGVKNT